MNARTIFLLAGLAFFCACRRPRPELIPEISPPLVQEVVFSWAGRPAGDMIFPCAAGIGWVDASGGIVTWDPGKKAAGTEIRLPFPVSAPPFRQGDLLVLNDAGGDRLAVFDLAGLKTIAELRGLGAGRVLGVDRDCLVYLEGDALAVNFWERPAGVFRLEGAGDRFFNCYFSPERILVLGRERLFTFWKKTDQFTSQALPQPAASPFLREGETIYYGSARRFLVKFSPADNRLAWKFRLGQVLEKQPLAFAGSIVAGTADHNFLQVNGRGSMLWWQALGSTMSFDLLPMSDHLAAFLMNGEVKFIDPRRQLVTEFKSKGHPLSQPVALAHDVYFMLREGGAAKLQRIGNRYGIDIELEAAPVRWPGRSVRFSLQPRNLREPAWECVIRDAAGNTVFSKSMATAERVSLAWLPLQPGKYAIRVQVHSLDRNEENEIAIQILDPRHPVPGFYLQF
jgi:hypothetical protein